MKQAEPSESNLPARPLRRRNPEESRRKILDAAEHAFARRGFEGARLRDIAHEAEVHHALVHHYYGDKRGLYKEVIERALCAVSTTGIERLAAPATLDHAAAELVSALFDFFSTRKDLLRIIEGAFRDRESVAYQLTAKSLGELAAPLLHRIRQRVLDGQERGEVRRDLDADAMLVFGFSSIVYPFVTGQGLMVSLGIPRATDEIMAARKAHLVQYIIGAMRPPR